MPCCAVPCYNYFAMPCSALLCVAARCAVLRYDMVRRATKRQSKHANMHTHTHTHTCAHTQPTHSKRSMALAKNTDRQTPGPNEKDLTDKNNIYI